MKFKLFIDTSIQGGFLALYGEEGYRSLLWQDSIVDNRRVSCDISFTFERSLEENKLAIDDLEGVIVSRGPGSFTGIRVGLSWVQGICLGRKGISLVAISSFSSITFALPYKRLSTQSQRVIIADTKLSGYEVMKSSSGKIETRVISLLSHDLRTRLRDFPCDENYIQDSIEISGELEEGKNFLKMHRSEIARYAFDGMIENYRSQEGHEGVFPESVEPLYYKSSSVEERSAKR